MDVKLAVGVLAFLGVVIGAALQYVFTRHVENLKHAQDLKSKTYADYLKSISEDASHNYEMGTEEQKELYSRIADSKTRICLYGSKEVVQAYSKFLSLGGIFQTEEQRDAFVKMVALMRKDSGGKTISNLKDIEVIVLGAANKGT